MVRKDIKQKFGDHLRSLRSNAALTQEQLAQRAGLDRSYIGSVERGERNISLENMERLSKALRLPVSRLLEFDNE
ncbi:helix-turn-helix transcriptional regulator [Planctomycetales bacterium ZRK34]|nr:helix-turn-helix transcriptional regulator [Planctomycetales bacterium ZRK34]